MGMTVPRQGTGNPLGGIREASHRESPQVQAEQSWARLFCPHSQGGCPPGEPPVGHLASAWWSPLPAEPALARAVLTRSDTPRMIGSLLSWAGWQQRAENGGVAAHAPYMALQVPGLRAGMSSSPLGTLRNSGTRPRSPGPLPGTLSGDGLAVRVLEFPLL